VKNGKEKNIKKWTVFFVNCCYLLVFGLSTTTTTTKIYSMQIAANGIRLRNYYLCDKKN
jgi:hypothetical protein